MYIPSPQSKRRARIEIIPLIDIVFFLLATFVMVSLSMVRSHGVHVNLPATNTGSQQVKDNQYTAISVTSSGDIYFNKEKISLSELAARIEGLKKSNRDPLIVLNGDIKAQYGTVVTVLDKIRKFGIKKVALETKQA